MKKSTKLKWHIGIGCILLCVWGTKLFANVFHLDNLEYVYYLERANRLEQAYRLESQPLSMEDFLSRGKEAAVATIKTVFTKEDSSKIETTTQANQANQDQENKDPENQDQVNQLQENKVQANNPEVNEAQTNQVQTNEIQTHLKQAGNRSNISNTTGAVAGGPLAMVSASPLDAVEKFLLVAIALTGITLFCVLFTLVVRFLSMRKKINVNATRNRFLKVMQKTERHSPAFFGLPNSEGNELDLPEWNMAEVKSESTIGETGIFEKIQEKALKKNHDEKNNLKNGADNHGSSEEKKGNIIKEEVEVKKYNAIKEANVIKQGSATKEEKKETNNQEKNQDKGAENVLEEDWETIAIRGFNQKYSQQYSQTNSQKTYIQASIEIPSKEPLQLLPSHTKQISSPEPSSAKQDSVFKQDSAFKQDSLPLDFIQNSHEISLKLQLAQTYIGIDDRANAILLLEEALKFGSIQEKASAKILMAEL